MKEVMEEFAQNTVWYWLSSIVLSVAIGFLVTIYWNLTWGLIHGLVTLIICAFIYTVAKPHN